MLAYLRQDHLLPPDLDPLGREVTQSRCRRQRADRRSSFAFFGSRMVDKNPVSDTGAVQPVEPPPADPASSAPPRRSPMHRGVDARDAIAELAERAQIISQEAGSKVAAAMKDVISAAAGIAGFSIESARDLVQYMVKRGQMTPEESEKLIREAEAAHDKRPASEKTRPTATKIASEKAAAAKAEAAARAAAQMAAAPPFRHRPTPTISTVVASAPAVKSAPAKPPAKEKPTKAAKPAVKAAAKSPAKPAAKPTSKNAKSAKPVKKGGKR